MVEYTEIEFPICLTSGNSLFAREIGLINDHDATDNESFLILVVHGGPGIADHTEILSGLQAMLQHVPVVQNMIFYDQLGCGMSDKPDHDMGHYCLNQYVKELSEVINFVKKRHPSRKICILGHSWGGQLTLELLLQQKELPEVECAIISNAPLDMATYEQRQKDLRKALDPLTREFYEQEEFELVQGNSIGAQILVQMVGISDTNITGELSCWSVLDRVNNIAKPCLFLCTETDTVSPDDYRVLQNFTHNVNEGLRVVIMDQGDHGPFFGPTAKEYFQYLEDFIQKL